MKKQTKIILGILACIMMMAIVLMYKRHWFGAGMKPKQAAISNSDRVVVRDTQEVILNPKKKVRRKRRKSNFHQTETILKILYPDCIKLQWMPKAC